MSLFGTTHAASQGLRTCGRREGASRRLGGVQGEELSLRDGTGWKSVAWRSRGESSFSSTGLAAGLASGFSVSPPLHPVTAPGAAGGGVLGLRAPRRRGAGREGPASPAPPAGPGCGGSAISRRPHGFLRIHNTPSSRVGKPESSRLPAVNRFRLARGSRGLRGQRPVGIPTGSGPKSSQVLSKQPRR